MAVKDGGPRESVCVEPLYVKFTLHTADGHERKMEFAFAPSCVETIARGLRSYPIDMVELFEKEARDGRAVCVYDSHHEPGLEIDFETGEGASREAPSRSVCPLPISIG